MLTPVADHADGGRGEDQDTLPEQSKLPQHHDLLPEEPDELGHAAGRVGDLHNPHTLFKRPMLLLFRHSEPGKKLGLHDSR